MTDIPFNSGEMRKCAIITILDDGIEEGDVPEVFIVQLGRVQGDIEDFDRTGLVIEIEDSDRLVVSFSQVAYTVQEGGMQEICVFIQNGTLADGVTALMDLRQVVTTNELSIVGDNTISFQSGSMRACRNLTANQDTIVEPQESFVLTLEQNGQSFEVDFGTNSSSTIRVQDDDFVQLRLNQTTFRVPEGNLTENTFDSMVANRVVCVVLINGQGGLERDVVINVTTAPLNAKSDVDYVSLNTSINIPSGSLTLDESCITFSILGDDQNESDEAFNIIFTPQLNDFFENNEPMATVLVVIEDDGDSLDCRTLRDPENGRVEHDGNDFGTVATYTCSPNFRLSPIDSAMRTCMMGDWDGESPTCIADCRHLSVEGGQVILEGAGEEMNFIGAGARASYSCNPNYVLMGAESRMCQSDGTWTGEDPTCDPILCNRLNNIESGGVRHDTTGPLVVGSTATYSCQSSFRLVGEATRTCMSNMEWSGEEPMCVADCRRLSVEGGQVILQGAGENFIGAGAQATYRCNQTYMLMGVENRTCQSDGTWTGEDPTCAPILCNRLDSIEFGDVRHDTGPLVVGAMATYSCQGGFRLVGGAMRTCTSNMEWSGEEPMCAGTLGVMHSRSVATAFSVAVLALLATLLL